MSIFDFKKKGVDHPLPVEGNEVLKNDSQPHYTVGPTNDGVAIIFHGHSGFSTTMTMNESAARKFIAVIEACFDNVESEEDETGT